MLNSIMENANSIGNKRNKCQVYFIVKNVICIPWTRYVVNVKKKPSLKIHQGFHLKITMENIGEN